MSRSYANLLDLAAGDAPLFTRPMQPLPHRGSNSSLTRSATASGALSDPKDDGGSVASDTPSSLDAPERLIVVANMLPLKAERNPLTQSWSFRWEEDALLLQMRDGIVSPEREDMEIIYVGSLKVEVDPADQDRVAAHLLDKFNCVPTFLSADLTARFYHGFCKQQLWPLFHYMLPLSPQHGGLFDRDLWQAYVAANKIFSDKVMEVISPEDDFVWVHDYHLMVLPTFLRKKFNRVRLGFFLHSPFPSSEIYRTLPVRDEILRSLLNADLIGFHTFDYARHFLSCCSRMLGLEYESKRGYIGLDYYGRTVGIKIMPVGVHMGQLSAALQLPDTEWRIGELRAEFAGKTIILGVDDMDIFKGIGLKLLAFEQMLKQHPEWVGTAVLVQITNPARGKGRDVTETRDEVHAIVKRIKEEFGREGYDPVVLYERHVPLYERIAFYTLAESLVVTAVRDGMNLTPYEYIVCRQGLSPIPDPTHSSGLAPSALRSQGRPPLGAKPKEGSHSSLDRGSAAPQGVESHEGKEQKKLLAQQQQQHHETEAGVAGEVGEAVALPGSSSDLSSSLLHPSAGQLGLNLAPIRTGSTNSTSGTSRGGIEAGSGSRQGTGTGTGTGTGRERKRSVIVVSEFIGCSPSLSGAIRINPWNFQAVADAMNSALTMSGPEQEIRHEKHFKYVRDHNVGYWANSFLSDLQRTCREHSRLRCYGIGFGLGFRTVALDPNFRKLQTEAIVRSYHRAQSRVLLLDYDGTMMPQATLNKTPNVEVLEVLNRLCTDRRNTVFIVSGRTRSTLADWFADSPNLGLAAEHGFFVRWKGSEDWQTTAGPAGSVDMAWKEAALPVLELYTECTDGSYVEQKESALVWHHRDADPDFGAWQAKELLDHLESVLANEPVAVRSGHHTVEVKPQGVSKGLVVEQLLGFISSSPDKKRPDFVLCVGDDRSDEDMFEKLEGSMVARPPLPAADVFACTVGQKPSKAKYYLDDTSEVLKMLRGLADSSRAGAAAGPSAPADGGVQAGCDLGALSEHMTASLQLTDPLGSTASSLSSLSAVYPAGSMSDISKGSQ